MDFVNELQIKAQELGASMTGFSWVGDKLPQDIEKLGYAVVVAVRLSDFIIEQIEDKPTYTYFHHYRTVNSLIDHITLRCMIMIQEKGYKAFAVPASQTVNDRNDPYTGVFQHKTAAVRAGLGWIGKSGLFISHQYGPRIRLGTILTDMELPVQNMPVENGCGECRECVRCCPASALTGNAWTEGCDRSLVLDAKACSDYMNANFKHIGRGSVCGICIKVCPAGVAVRKKQL
jgi:epoxyqueuosine reductase